MLITKTRICTKCEENKPIDQYHIDSKGRDGRAARCKSCKNNRTVSIPIQEEVLERKGMVDTGLTFPKGTKFKEFNEDIFAAHPNFGTVKVQLDEKKLHALTLKFPKHKVLSWNEHGATFQHVSDPKIVWKGKTPEEAIEKALAY